MTGSLLIFGCFLTRGVFTSEQVTDVKSVTRCLESKRILVMCLYDVSKHPINIMFCQLAGHQWPIKTTNVSNYVTVAVSQIESICNRRHFPALSQHFSILQSKPVVIILTKILRRSCIAKLTFIFWKCYFHYPHQILIVRFIFSSANFIPVSSMLLFL